MYFSHRFKHSKECRWIQLIDQYPAASKYLSKILYVNKEVRTYSRYASFHISMIPNRWYLDTNIQATEVLQRYPSILVLRDDSHTSHLGLKSKKAVYVELFGLSKKAVDFALKTNMQAELLSMLKSFIYDAQNKVETAEPSSTVITNPDITRHKGRPPKRFKSNIETALSKGSKQVLKDSAQVNVIVDNNDDENVGNDRYKNVNHVAGSSVTF